MVGGCQATRREVAFIVDTVTFSGAEGTVSECVSVYMCVHVCECVCVDDVYNQSHAYSMHPSTCSGTPINVGNC